MKSWANKMGTILLQENLLLSRTGELYCHLEMAITYHRRETDFNKSVKNYLAVDTVNSTVISLPVIQSDIKFIWLLAVFTPYQCPWDSKTTSGSRLSYWPSCGQDRSLSTNQSTQGGWEDNIFYVARKKKWVNYSFTHIKN